MKDLSIRLKFILAFLASSLIAIGLVAAFFGIVTNRTFQTLIVEEQKDDLKDLILNYYEAQGNLAGIAKVLNQPPFNPSGGHQAPMDQTALPGNYVLTLPDGRILYNATPQPLGTFLLKPELENADVIEIDEKPIAYLVFIDPIARPNPREQAFINQTNSALFCASLGAVILSIGLGLVFTNSLLKPLARLNTGIKNMKKGNLSQAVKVSSQDELGQVIITFNQMSKALAEASEQRKQMTADIAHELRSPLTVISGYLEAIQDGSLSASPDRINIIKNEVNQLNRLIEDLRTLALADAGELKILKTPINIESFFDHLQSSLGLIARKKQIELIFKKEGDNVQIKGDERRLVQALTNLINNALRYTPENGQISVTAKMEKDHTLIFIKDTGSGIPTEHIDKIFERFYRADPARQTHQGETGLGLSIVQSIVKAHGGTISVQSKEGQGTIFAIRLPQNNQSDY
jgi:signal transduction histidine kinase